MKAPSLPRNLQYGGIRAKLFDGSKANEKLVSSISFNQTEGLTIDGYPANLAVESTEDGIVLTWDDLATNEDKILVERSLDGLLFVGLTVLTPDSITYTDPIAGLIDDTTYYYRITYIRNHSYARSLVQMGTFLNPSLGIPSGAIITADGDYIKTSLGDYIIADGTIIPNNAVITGNGDYIKTVNNEFITI